MYDAVNESRGRRIQSLKLSEHVARDLATYIVDRQLPEGARLPPEREMLETLQVGRSTLREAFRLLESRGVISMKSGRHGGPIVRYPRSADLSDALTLILEFESASLSVVLDARLSLEPMIARLAARKISPHQLKVLRSTVSRMREPAADHEVFLQQNQLFHETIADAAGSDLLRIFNEAIAAIADGVVVRDQYTVRRRREVADLHEIILHAFESGDPEAAEAAMRRHVEEAGKYWQIHPELFHRSLTWGR